MPTLIISSSSTDSTELSVKRMPISSSPAHSLHISNFLWVILRWGVVSLGPQTQHTGTLEPCSPLPDLCISMNGSDSLSTWLKVSGHTIWGTSRQWLVLLTLPCLSLQTCLSIPLPTFITVSCQDHSQSHLLCHNTRFSHMKSILFTTQITFHTCIHPVTLLLWTLNDLSLLNKCL